MYDVIIAGAGIAGLTAAVYCKRAGKSVAVFENEIPGGQIFLAENIENYPGVNGISGRELSKNLLTQAETVGADVVYEKIIKVEDKGDFKEVTTNKNVYTAKGFIIATGAKHKKLMLEKEDEFTGRGVSYCAICDGRFFEGKDVAVVGGGNAAVDEAIYLSKICKKVYLIHRRDSFRAEQTLIDKLYEIENITILLSSTVDELCGNESLEMIKVNDENLKVDALFVSIGREPDNNAFENLVELDEKGYIITDESCLTKTDNVFAIGDCRKKEIRQLTTAAADGTIAALNIK